MPESVYRIYLSPHFDDAAFSLGAWIAAHPGGTIVDVFTRSGFVMGVTPGVPPRDEVERISALRQAEDRAFTDRYGLEVVELGHEEPSLRGRRPRDLGGLADDIAQVREQLTEVLDRLGQGATIYCPAAIGAHVNHLAVRAVAIEWAMARGREADLRFYEDLPYAVRLQRRVRGMRDLRLALGGRPIRRTAWRAGAEKLAAVNLYPSQHKAPVRSLWRFSPWAPWPIGAHEAVWSITTS